MGQLARILCSCAGCESSGIGPEMFVGQDACPVKVLSRAGTMQLKKV
jgi:hypothetical protein